MSLFIQLFLTKRISVAVIIPVCFSKIPNYKNTPDHEMAHVLFIMQTGKPSQIYIPLCMCRKVEWTVGIVAKMLPETPTSCNSVPGLDSWTGTESRPPANAQSGRNRRQLTYLGPVTHAGDPTEFLAPEFVLAQA